jgi:dihydroxy-acid dehydratase
VRDGDEVTIDIDARELSVALSDDEIEERLRDYKPPEAAERGVMAKYAATVGSASEGAITA